MSSSMITLSVVIYIIFLLTSTSLFVVANTTMSVTGKIHPFVSVISMSSYKGFTQFFSKRLCPYSAGLMQCAGTTKPVDDYTIATYQQPNLIMFEGLPFDGPSKTCQKNPTKKECPTVVPVKSDLVTVENKYFGVKGGMKVKIIFLFYNPGELTLLPSSTKRKEILESASRLKNVLEDVVARQTYLRGCD